MSLERAQDELRVARAILLDASAPAAAAAEHLHRAHDALHGTDGDNGDDSRIETRSQGPDSSRRELLLWLGDLEARLAQRQQPPLTQRWRWAFRAVGWLGGLAVVVALWSATGDDIAPGKWRARYYDTPTFAGEPIERRESDVDFRWRQRRPLRSLGRDHFSVTFETCLHVWKARAVRFQVVANNGARLAIDGNTVVNETGRSRVSAGPIVELAPGVHHIRLDYVERTGHAEVVLRASLDETRPKSLNPDRLSYPQAGDNPCPEP